MCSESRKQQLGPLRKLYDQNALIINIHSRHCSLFYHLGYGNLQDCVFIAAALHHLEEVSPGLVAVQGTLTVGNNFRIALDHLLPQSDWHVSFWKIDEGQSSTPRPFTASVIRIRRVDECNTELLWRSPPSGGPPGPGPRAIMDAAKGEREEEPNDLDREDDHDSDGGDGGDPDPDRRVWRRERHAGDIVALAWALDDEHEPLDRDFVDGWGRRRWQRWHGPREQRRSCPI